MWYSIEVYEGIKTLRIICEINNFIYFDMVIWYSNIKIIYKNVFVNLPVINYML